MIGATIVAFLFIRNRGEMSLAPESHEAIRFGVTTNTTASNHLLSVLLALVVVIVAARLVGAAFRKMQQPPVVGEVVAGIMLGPSLLGRIAPGVSGFVLPTSTAPALNTIAQVGVILFMFLVGLELDTSVLRQNSRSSVAISHASIVAPFLLGSSLALWLYPRLSSRDVPFTYFALFMGVSMSVTAFPVLARILTDRRMHRSRLGVVALTCAAIDDVTAWCLLAFVVSVVHAQGGHAVRTTALTVGYIAMMFGLGRPLLLRLSRWRDRENAVSQSMLAVVLISLLLSALATEAIGIHALFGAFLLGALIPHDSNLARDTTAMLEHLVVVLFLPAFFAFTGMRTQIGLVSGGAQWAICGLIILVACAGKFGGTFVAARITGLGNRDAAALGILMNTRGLMELVVLNIGLDLRVISPTLFAMLVIMAVTTTLLTTPVLHVLTRRHAEYGPVADSAGHEHVAH